MAYRFDPHTQTWLTSGMVCTLSLNVLMAISEISSKLRLSLLIFRKTMGTRSASALETAGLSTSGGRKRMTCDTLSRTSLAAASKSTSRSNSTVIVLRPSRLTDVRVRIPATPLMDSSSGSVICDSMTSALAPV